MITHRFIPAHTGNIGAGTGGETLRAVHPRTHGEHPFWGTLLQACGGSSPHTRGTCLGGLHDPGDLRFIPAHTGNMNSGAPPCRDKTVHPRTHGEHLRFDPVHAGVSGSSPHTRGTSPCMSLAGHRLRFIPAHTGNMKIYPAYLPYYPVHPRTHGEHRCTIVHPASAPGSSPHTRGTSVLGIGPRIDGRFIPAHTGNITVTSIEFTAMSVHPRTHGEHILEAAKLLDVLGSSPHTRGTSFLVWGGKVVIRFIPAHTGNIALPRPRPWPRTVHPRTHGEHLCISHNSNPSVGSSPHTRGTFQCYNNYR